VQDGFRVAWYELGAAKPSRQWVRTAAEAELLTAEKAKAFALKDTGLRQVTTRLRQDHIPFVEDALRILEKHDYLKVDEPATAAQLVKAVDWFVANYRDRAADMPTVEQFIPVFLKAKQAHAPATHHDYQKNLEAFVRAGYGGHRLDEITAKMIADFLAKVKVGPTTKAKYFGALRALFYFAMAKSEFVETPWLEHNPALDLHHPPKPSVPRRVRYTLPEVKDLIQVAIYVGAAPLILLRLFTMLRTEEAERFIRGPVAARRKPGRPRAGSAYSPWAHLDLEQKTLSYHEADGADHSRDITLYPALVDWLKFFQAQGIPLELTRREIAARRIAVPRKFGDDYANLVRHTAISFRATHCGSLLEAAVEADNSENIIKRHYFRKVSPQDAAEFHTLTPDKFDLRPYVDPNFPSPADRKELEKRYKGIGAWLRKRRRQGPPVRK